MTFLAWRHDCICFAKLYFVRLLESHSTYADYICNRANYRLVSIPVNMMILGMTVALMMEKRT